MTPTGHRGGVCSEKLRRTLTPAQQRLQLNIPSKWLLKQEVLEMPDEEFSDYLSKHIDPRCRLHNARYQGCSTCDGKLPAPFGFDMLCGLSQTLASGGPRMKMSR